MKQGGAGGVGWTMVVVGRVEWAGAGWIMVELVEWDGPWWGGVERGLVWGGVGWGRVCQSEHEVHTSAPLA